MRAVEEWQGGQLLPRLPRTGELPDRLREVFMVTVLQGPQASEVTLRKQPLQTYGYQVYATHGILDGTVPYIQEPALVLSQVEVNSSEPQQYGFLTMSEVLGLELNAEVVALTACSTGVGKNVAGEGVMGLGRAFQYAGARSVLMSLWSVDEESTVLFTERFFTHLQAGKEKLAALRQARADVRQAGYEHPFFWAPFILVGER